MKRTTRQQLLIGFLVVSIIVATLVGFFYWQEAVVALLALWAFTKKLFTVNGLIMVVKKLPLLLLAGSKKLIIQTLGGLLLLSARTRVRFVREAIVRFKLKVRSLLRMIRFHWTDMNPWERVVVYVASVPLTLIAVILLLLFSFVPRTMRSFAVKKVQESTAATVIAKGVPDKAKKVVEQLHGDAKTKLKQTLKTPPDTDA